MEKGGVKTKKLPRVTSMVTVSSMDELILAHRAELERWGAYNKQLNSVLFLVTKWADNRFLARFATRPDSRQQPDEQAASKAMEEKYLKLSMLCQRILMRKLNSMIMRSTQDSGQYDTEVHQQRDELELNGESVTEARIVCLIREGLNDEYEPIRFIAERDLEISLK